LRARRYTHDDVVDEVERTLATYFALIDGEMPPNNKIAPGPHGWPDDFENFLRSDSVVRMWPSEYPEMWKVWAACSTPTPEPMMPPAELIELVGGGGREGYRSVGAEFRIRAILAGLRPDHRVLDVGCGSGRIAGALVDYLTDGGSYVGFDIVPAAIDWCREEITSRHPNFCFDVANIHSGFYRPEGAVSPLDYRFPYEDDSFDFVILTSVFTHLLPDAVDAYAREVARVLKPGGRCLATFFLGTEHSYEQLDQGLTAIAFSSNHGVYRTVAETPTEWAVFHDESSVLAMLRLHGLNVAEPVQYGRWAAPDSQYSFQDIVILKLDPVPAPPESSGLQLVTVSHRPSVFEEHLGSSTAALQHPIVKYNNTVENVPLPARYNTFIDTEMTDGWVAFVHHDFCFDSDPLPILTTASRDNIYGVIGARLTRGGRSKWRRTSREGSRLWKRGRSGTAHLLGRVKCEPVVHPERVVGEPFDLEAALLRAEIDRAIE
jgi:SAM-dependent methyltransferase